MEKFIAYFDYLGFKQFIDNNDLDYQRRIVGNNFRDIESALGQGKSKEAPHGYIADLPNSRINCINFSDTVVFWTNDDSEASLMEILEVTLSVEFPAITKIDFLVQHELTIVQFMMGLTNSNYLH